jgi:hypothetical protein
LNYFNYFTELEEAFVRRRGKHLWLGPVDWALMESWKERGVPLYVAIRGVERAFDSYESKPRHRSVKSLMYCREEVEAQYAEWLESKVGAGGDGDGSGAAAAGADTTGEGLPFPRPAIEAHLSRAREALSEVCGRLNGPGDAAISECFARVAALLQEIETDLAQSVRPDAEKLEQSLAHLERQLDDAIRAHASTVDMSAAQAYTEEQLVSYRKRMDQTTYDQTFNNLLLKRLREGYGLPRLSLFYL